MSVRAYGSLCKGQPKSKSELSASAASFCSFPCQFNKKLLHLNEA